MERTIVGPIPASQVRHALRFLCFVFVSGLSKKIRLSGPGIRITIRIRQIARSVGTETHQQWHFPDYLPTRKQRRQLPLLSQCVQRGSGICTLIRQKVALSPSGMTRGQMSVPPL